MLQRAGCSKLHVLELKAYSVVLSGVFQQLDGTWEAACLLDGKPAGLVPCKSQEHCEDSLQNGGGFLTR